MTFLKLFDYQTDNPEWKRLCSLLYARIPARARDDGKSMVAGILEYGPSQWMTPPKVDGVLPRELEETDSTVSGQKRIAILRSGEGAEPAGTLHPWRLDRRPCPQRPDGRVILCQRDEPDRRHRLLFVGHPVSPGVRHPLRCHMRWSWWTRICRQRNSWRFRPPARVTGYLPLGPAQVIEMSDPELWPQSHLTEYCRQDWLIDVSDSEAYFVDAFWINGGKTHDYIWQAPYRGPFP